MTQAKTSHCRNDLCPTSDRRPVTETVGIEMPCMHLVLSFTIPYIVHHSEIMAIDCTLPVSIPTLTKFYRWDGILVLHFYVFLDILSFKVAGVWGRLPYYLHNVGTNFKQRPVKGSCTVIMFQARPCTIYWKKKYPENMVGQVNLRKRNGGVQKSSLFHPNFG